MLMIQGAIVFSEWANAPPPPDETMDMDMEMDSIPAHKLFSVPVECVCKQL